MCVCVCMVRDTCVFRVCVCVCVSMCAACMCVCACAACASVRVCVRACVWYASMCCLRICLCPCAGVSSVCVVMHVCAGEMCCAGVCALCWCAGERTCAFSAPGSGKPTVQAPHGLVAQRVLQDGACGAVNGGKALRRYGLCLRHFDKPHRHSPAISSIAMWYGRQPKFI